MTQRALIGVVLTAWLVVVVAAKSGLAGPCAPSKTRKPPITKFTLTNGSGRVVSPTATATDKDNGQHPLYLQKVNGAVWESNDTVMDVPHVTLILTSSSLAEPQTIPVDADAGYYLMTVYVRLTGFEGGRFTYEVNKTQGLAQP